ncbi:MAG: DNA-binding protein [Candidatus Nanohaloarchaea archaeon]
MPDEDEIEKLKEEKLREIQEGEEDQETRAEERKNQVWSQAKQYMSPDAKSRLANVKAANERLALAVARQIATLGKSGRIEKVDEEQMKSILKSVQDQKGSEPDIKFRR